MSLFPALLTALALTLIFELLFALLWGVRKNGLLLVLLMNVMTNPAVNLLHYITVYLLGWPAVWVVLVLEIAVVVTEGLCCKDVIKRPWLFALLINGFSYTMGELLQHWF